MDIEKCPIKRKRGLVGIGGRQERERGGESNQNTLCMCMRIVKENLIKIIKY